MRAFDAPRLVIVFACIVATLIFAIENFETRRLPHLKLEKEDSLRASKNDQPSGSNSSMTQDKSIVRTEKVDYTHPWPFLDSSGSAIDIGDYMNDYLHNNNSEDAVLDLAEVLHTNSYSKEAIDILLNKVQASINEGKEVPIEMLQLLRTVMHEQGYLDDYKAFLSSMPNDYLLKPQLISEMSAFLSQQGSSDDAEVILTDGLRIYPNNTSVWDAYASFLKSEGRVNEAESAYQYMLQQIEDTAETRLELGRLYLANGNLSAAQQVFEQVIRIAPGYKEEIAQLIHDQQS